MQHKSISQAENGIENYIDGTLAIQEASDNNQPKIYCKRSQRMF
jgi:hypothetical protein